MSEEAFDLAINKFKLRIYLALCAIGVCLGAMIFGMGEMWSFRFMAAVGVCVAVYVLCCDIVSLFILSELVGDTNLLEETAIELGVWEDDQSETTPE